MTVEEWIASRDPAPLPQLLERMRSILSDCAESHAGGSLSGTESHDAKSRGPDVVSACRSSAVHTLEGLLRRPNASRDAAVDLLAADAFATYTCEASCDTPATLIAAADRTIADLLSVSVHQST